MISIGIVAFISTNFFTGQMTVSVYRKKRPIPGEILNAVKKVLSDPSYRNNAKRLQEGISRYDAPAKAVELLEELVSTIKKTS